MIVPVGSTEQHGPHLALTADVLIPQEVARRVAPKVGAVVAPPVSYALSYPHVGFKGLVHIRIPTFMALIEDLSAAFAHVGFKRIVFLNGHYDNTYAIAYACANAADRLPRDVKAFPINYWDGIPPEVASQYMSLEKGLHANAAETSAVLAINPALVDMEKANAEFPPFPDFTVESGAVHTAFFFSAPGLGLLGDEVRHLGRRAPGHPARWARSTCRSPPTRRWPCSTTSRRRSRRCRRGDPRLPISSRYESLAPPDMLGLLPPLGRPDMTDDGRRSVAHVPCFHPGARHSCTQLPATRSQRRGSIACAGLVRYDSSLGGALALLARLDGKSVPLGRPPDEHHADLGETGVSMCLHPGLMPVAARPHGRRLRRLVAFHPMPHATLEDHKLVVSRVVVHLTRVRAEFHEHR